MARQIQLRRGTTTQTDAFTGALAEVTVDTDKDTVVVHDGSTAGGHPLVKTSDLGTAATTAATDYATAAQGALADTSVQPDDSPSFGSVTVSGTVDGRDVAADGTKLDGVEAGATADQTGAQIKTAYEAEPSAFTDAQFTKLAGIEASADVTDTVNVTASGALMDSEITNLAQVKAFDSSDYATDAQGTTADAALPRAGGAMTGPITTNSTFDGVDIATRDAVLTSTTTTANAALPKAGGAMTGAITTNSTFDGRAVATDGAKLDNITVTQAVDLDQMEIDIAALANGMVYKGDWDASASTFPGSGSAQIGWFYYVSVAGTVGGVSFAVGDNIVAIADNASTSTYASNWSKHDQTDAVTAVVGLNGSITKSGLLSALNVEDGADVTDAANVTTAGALMDSEVTNLAQVKAFDTTDYATAAQGSTADAALPKSGGAMTGAITTSSTFDGRDVATDGAKLDGIEAGATADQTNAEIRAAVEAATDSNVFTDADHTKLNAIAAGATNVTNNNQLTNGAGYTTYTANQSLNTTNSPSFAGVNINGDLTVTDDIYLADKIFHEGDEDTYLQFSGADQWRVVTGGSLRLNVTNDEITVYNGLTVDDGRIVLNGTGRIEGVDTVSSGTDAANKSYVDNATSGFASTGKAIAMAIVFG